MWKVTVIQDENGVMFGFNLLNDAVRFAEDCLECGDKGTKVMIKKEEQ